MISIVWPPSWELWVAVQVICSGHRHIVGPHYRLHSSFTYGTQPQHITNAPSFLQHLSFLLWPGQHVKLMMGVRWHLNSFMYWCVLLTFNNITLLRNTSNFTKPLLDKNYYWYYSSSLGHFLHLQLFYRLEPLPVACQQCQCCQCTEGIIHLKRCIVVWLLQHCYKKSVGIYELHAVFCDLTNMLQQLLPSVVL